MPLSNFQLSAASGVPFYRQVVDALSDRVRSGALPAGTLLPSARALSTQLRVSLITIRRAYADLEAANLVVRRQGQGTFVADEVGEAARVQGEIDARVALEAAVERAIALGLDELDIATIVAEHAHKLGGHHD